MQITNNLVETVTANFGIRLKSDADLVRLRDHFTRVAPLASHPENRLESEALIVACQYEIDRRVGALGAARFTYD